MNARGARLPLLGGRPDAEVAMRESASGHGNECEVNWNGVSWWQKQSRMCLAAMVIHRLGRTRADDLRMPVQASSDVLPGAPYAPSARLPR